MASLLAVQVRFVTRCSIKGEVQCNEMFPFLQNVNNDFLPLLELSALTIDNTKILILLVPLVGKL